MSSAQRATNKKAKLEQEIANTYGVVHPDGHVSQHVVMPIDLEMPLSGDRNVGRSKGDTVLQYMAGRVRLRGKYEEKGCRMLDEVCKADGQPEKYEAWREIIRARKLGYKVKGQPKDYYPKTVFRLRDESDKGVVAGVVFVSGRGLVPATTLSEEEAAAAKAEQVASTLEKSGMGRPKVKPKNEGISDGE
jgi:hypothetical protein